MVDNIHQGDAASVAQFLAPKLVHAIVCSPPYYKLRKYGLGENELGREKTPKEYIDRLVEIFHELRHVLRDDGTLWIVIGDTVKNSIPFRIPSKLTDALEADGWIVHPEVHWYKNNIMTMGYKNRFISDYEKILFLSKKKKYYFQHQYEPYSPETWSQFGQKYDSKGVKDYESAGAPNASKTKSSILDGFPLMPPIGGVKNVGQSSTYTGDTPEFNFGRGRLMRATWLMNTQQYHGAHFAVYPIPLAERIILSSVPFKYCTECGLALKPVYSEWKIATRPGRYKKDSKSGTDDDPNKGLHLSELSKKRLKFVRWLTGYKKQCEHETFEHGCVLDPFMGVGSTAIAALKNGRHYLGIEIKQEYIDQAVLRINNPKYKMDYYDFKRDDWQSKIEYFMPSLNEVLITTK